MGYQVLARKWRPGIFAEVVGQQHILTALTNSLNSGRLHHAYLFSGMHGVGKTSIARLLAKSLNCETGITATPCGKCHNCLEIEQGRFVDLLEIDAASRTKVEDTRDLLDNIQYAPTRGRFKVYLIDEVHMLSRHSFNALLKTLEEPPDHVKFLLATTDPHKLPVTVLSRCLHFHLKALDAQQIQQQLMKIMQAENLTAEAKALQLLSRAAAGSMRDALSLTDQAIALSGGDINAEIVRQMLGVLNEEQPLAIIEAIESADGGKVMDLVEQLAYQSVNWEELLTEMLTILHQTAMLQLLATPTYTLHYDEYRLRQLAKKLSPEDLQLYYQIILTGKKELPFAPDMRMGVEMTLLRLLAFQPEVLVNDESSPSSQINVVVNEEKEKDKSGIPSVATQKILAHSIANKIDEQPYQHDVSLMDKQANHQPEIIQAKNEQKIESTAELQQVQLASGDTTNLPKTTLQLLQARNQLLSQQEAKKKEKKTAKLETETKIRLETANNASLMRNKKETTEAIKVTESSTDIETNLAYQWKARASEQVQEKEITPRIIRQALEDSKSSKLIAELAEESMKLDKWSAMVGQLSLPKLVQQLALNSILERPDDIHFCLHLRSSHRHLNTESAKQILQKALMDNIGKAIELSIIEDDNNSEKTPIEWRQYLYEEKLIKAKESIEQDSNIHDICRLFDAELDISTVRPI